MIDRETIIKLAREAGGWGDDAVSFCEFAELERFAQLVAEHEREECAKVVEEVSGVLEQWARHPVGDAMAAAIRSRK